MYKKYSITRTTNNLEMIQLHSLYVYPTSVFLQGEGQTNDVLKDNFTR